jgi:hypothetical protein
LAVRNSKLRHHKIDNACNYGNAGSKPTSVGIVGFNRRKMACAAIAWPPPESGRLRCRWKRLNFLVSVRMRWVGGHRRKPKREERRQRRADVNCRFRCI